MNNREFVARMFWWKDQHGAYYIVFFSVDEEVHFGSSTKTVRGKSWGVTKLEPCGKLLDNGRRSQCRVTSTQKVDAGGYIPSFLVIIIGR